MKENIKKGIVLLNLWRILPVYLIIHTLPKETEALIRDEILHWNKCLKENRHGIFLFAFLLLWHKEYRNLLCYRIKITGGLLNMLKSKITAFLFPNMDTLYIMCPSIGPRLFIQHGFATWISAESIGSDCWINQQVTVGYTFDPKAPTIGNGVRISAGAKVVGQISIGDNAIIAANAAVVKDVAPYTVVGGVPAKEIGTNTDHILFSAQ